MKRKFLLVLFTAVTAICCAIGLAGCVSTGDDTNSNNEEQLWTTEAVYARAQELGYSGTLEEFIETVSGNDGADGVGVSNIYIDENGQLIVTLSDGRRVDCGNVRGEQGPQGVSITGAKIDDDGNLILELSEGEPINCGKVAGDDGKQGEDGPEGRGVLQAYIDKEGQLIIVYTDGSSQNTGAVIGESGQDGVGIQSIFINDNGELVVTLTNSTELNLGAVVGKNGTDGDSVCSADINESGELVLTFVSGKTLTVGNVMGADGLSVTTAKIDEQGHLILTFSDNHSLDCGSVNGKDGVGIESIYFNEKAELIIELSDGNEVNCGKIPVCTHSYSEWQTVLEPTCTSVGYETRTCAICGNVEYNFIEKTGHVFGEWKDLINTCTEHWQTRICEVCGDSQLKELTPDGHVFVNGVCIICGEIDADSVDISYLQQYNGTYGYEFLGTLDNGEALQELYEKIDNEVKKFHVNTSADLSSDGVLTEIDFSYLGLSADMALSVWKTYKDDNPLYYWLSNTVQCSDTSITLLVDSDYLKGEARKYYNQLIEDSVEKYASLLYKGANSYDTALAYHDAILMAVDYSYDENNQAEDSAWAHNVVGVFSEQGAVCEGYARTYQLLLNYSGIENLFVTGDSNGEEHAWNLVKMDDGNWYWCDLTWDDTFVGGLNTNWKWGISYNYFMVNDTQNTLIAGGGWDYGEEIAFLQNHTYDTSANSGIDFLYDLPERNKQTYTSDSISLFDDIEADSMTLQVVGYNTLELHAITGKGHFDIPSTVEYAGRTFTIISVGSGNNDMTYNGNITSVTIPESVIFIWDHAFREYALENIYVDEANAKFTSVDGVLFTKSLYTLIQYPSANTRTEYVIPDDTHILAYWSFDQCAYLSKLTIGKNVDTVWYANWGGGYRDEDTDDWFGGNIVNGGIESLCNSLVGDKQIIIHPENTSYQSDEFAIYNYGKTAILYVYNKEITTYHIPNTITYLDTTSSSSDVFGGCSKLESFTVDSDHPTFKACDGVLYNNTLTEILSVPVALKGKITIPEGITAIGAEDHVGRVFASRDITEVVLPHSLKLIGDSAFSDCSSLTSITIPDGVTFIGSSAFSGCSTLTAINIPDGVTFIGNYAFSGCSALTSIDIPYGVTKISNSMLSDCSAIRSITLPDSLISIGEDAFKGCSSLEDIVIPNSVISIGSNAFYKCIALKYNEYDNACYLGNEINPYMVLVKVKDSEITACVVNESTKIICGGSNDADNGFNSCRFLESITIPDGIINVGENAFYGCNSLKYNEYDNAYYLGNEDNPYLVLVKAKDTSITNCIINENTKVISGIAFDGCNLLEEIQLPDGIISIGTAAFRSCKSLVNIIIPESVISVGEWAFFDCSQLVVYYKGTSEQWSGIFIISDINSSNEYLLNAEKYYYSESEPAELGNFWHFAEDGITIVIW